MTTINILAIPGSLRTGSLNRAALIAASELAPEGMTVEIASLDGIPFYNADDERTEGFSPPVASLRERVMSADASCSPHPSTTVRSPGSSRTPSTGCPEAVPTRRFAASPPPYSGPEGASGRCEPNSISARS